MGRSFTYATEFSGLGGSKLGFEQAGGTAMYAIECEMAKRKDRLGKTVLDAKGEPEWVESHSQNAFKHLEKNFPELRARGGILNRDICKVTGEELLALTGLQPGQLDILQSSAPCQAFAMNNTRRDVNDSRNKLFYASMEHIKVLRPKICIFENVKGFSSGKSRGVFVQIVKDLEALGYRVKAWVLNASDYGAPQTRPRTWVIAIRSDLGVEPSIPKPTFEVLGLTEALKGVSDVIGHQQGDFYRDFIPGNCPCSTITKTPGLLLIDRDGTARKPTVEELRILSTFPADYEFTGSYTQIHNRLGNTVLPLQMRVLAEQLFDLVLSTN